MDTWSAANQVSTTVDLVPDGGDDQLAVMTLGLALTGALAGDIVQIRTNAGANSVPNFIVQIISDDAPFDQTVFTVATPKGQAAMSAEASFVSVPAYAEIGTDRVGKSFLVGKGYKDVLRESSTDELSQTYLGEYVSGFSTSATYGEIVTGAFSTMGNGYIQEPAESYEQQVVTATGTVTPAGTANPLNASIDIPLVTSDGTATDWCTESVVLTLDSGLDPETCLGRAAPKDYALGTAEITVALEVYNSTDSYKDLMPSKLTQDPISFGFGAENESGGYYFSISAMQLTFPDPGAQGQNEQVTITATGTAKVGPNGASSLRIYQLEA
jgi:hypothetical protein